MGSCDPIRPDPTRPSWDVTRQLRSKWENNWTLSGLRWAVSPAALVVNTAALARPSPAVLHHLAALSVLSSVPSSHRASHPTAHAVQQGKQMAGAGYTTTAQTPGEGAESPETGGSDCTEADLWV